MGLNGIKWNDMELNEMTRNEMELKHVYIFNRIIHIFRILVSPWDSTVERRVKSIRYEVQAGLMVFLPSRALKSVRKHMGVVFRPFQGTMESSCSILRHASEPCANKNYRQ